jgi:hypothetical protein
VYEGGAWEFLRALSALIWGFPWLNAFLILGLVYLVFLIYRMHTGASNFKLDDLFLNDSTRRADLQKIVVAAMAGLSVWVIIHLVNSDKPVETILLGVLGIFVAGRAVTAVFAQEKGPAPTQQAGPDKQ